MHIIFRSPQNFIIVVQFRYFLLSICTIVFNLTEKGIERSTVMLFCISKSLRAGRLDARLPLETFFASPCLFKTSPPQAVEQAWSLPSPPGRLAVSATGEEGFVSPLTVERRKGYQYDRAQSDGNRATFPIVAAQFRMFCRFFLLRPDRTSETIGDYVPAC